MASWRERERNGILKALSHMIGMQPTISCVTFFFFFFFFLHFLRRREKNKFFPFPFPIPKEARITPSFLFSQNQTTPISLFLRTFHVIRDKNKVPLMKLLHLLPLALLLLPSLPLPFLSVLVAASPFPSPISPFLDSMAASPPGGYFTDLFLSTALVFKFPLFCVSRNPDGNGEP